MDYFFCCFRTDDDLCPPQSLLIKEPELSKSPSPVIYRRPFLPIQITREDHSPCNDNDNSLSEILLGGNEERMLKTEAGFIKVCGTSTKTPVKTRKLCSKYKDPSPSSEDSSPPNLHSCLANLGKQAENSMTHTQVAEDFTPEPGRNKYVHFKANEITSSSSGSGPESARDLGESKPVPYPTPLKLTDEMQTPGTVYQATFETLKNRKYHHIRSQYVYPVHKKSLKEEGSYFNNQMSDETPGDKMIMGRVAADWNEEEFCSISPKWLDRNGIQNSDSNED